MNRAKKNLIKMKNSDFSKKANLIRNYISYYTITLIQLEVGCNSLITHPNILPRTSRILLSYFYETFSLGRMRFSRKQKRPSRVIKTVDRFAAELHIHKHLSSERFVDFFPARAISRELVAGC